jgi:hypothetical protein
MNEIPSWAALLIGGGAVIFLAGILLLSINGADNVKRKKDAKRNPDNSDAILFDLPDAGYDSTGRLIPTALEALAAGDEVEIQTIEHPQKNKKKLDHRRSRDPQKKSHGY